MIVFEKEKILAQEFFNNLYLHISAFLLSFPPFASDDDDDEEEEVRGEKNATRPSKVFSKRVEDELREVYQASRLRDGLHRILSNARQLIDWL